MPALIHSASSNSNLLAPGQANYSCGPSAALFFINKGLLELRLTHLFTHCGCF